MEYDDVPVPGGDLRIVRYGQGPRLIIAVHGITASLMAWQKIGTSLPPGWTLVAMDLRGRGHSAHLPGPYGLRRHAEDVERVAAHVGADATSVLTGHSMGAYVAVLHAADREYARTVLIDGGLPLPAPQGMSADTALELSLGPAIARLSQRFADEDAYVAFFRAHPALADWSPAIEDYVRYDALPVEGGVRSRVREDAVRQDGRELLTEGEALGAALGASRSPLTLLRAPRGLLNQETGMLPDELTAVWTAKVPGLRDELVPDCNHYTIAFDDRCAALVAERLTYQP
ncbi:alpha/beta hydrolase [Acrocarpospora catenulata]|uniref:alpha/beta hydrolase n=1 Tax=Acrocarpospora catenulata TaxID=2836182 RepID=UPI001BDB6477|nr:alpha/beta hydrolase [Acrocarpospora catenulata]